MLLVGKSGLASIRKNKESLWSGQRQMHSMQNRRTWLRVCFRLAFVAKVLDYDFLILTVKKVSGNVDGCVGGTSSHTDQLLLVSSQIVRM